MGKEYIPLGIVQDGDFITFLHGPVSSRHAGIVASITSTIYPNLLRIRFTDGYEITGWEDETVEITYEKGA